MWKIYAVEPSWLLHTPERFKMLRSLFDSDRGRWIGTFPKDWKTHVKILAETWSPIEYKRLEEWLSRDKGRFFGVGKTNFSPSVSWLENAEFHQDRNQAFELILSSENPRNHASVLDPFCEEDLDEALPSPHLVSVFRDVNSMIEPIKPLLLKANALKFIDPHFDTLPRFLDFIKNCLILTCKKEIKPPIIEIHAGIKLSDSLCAGEEYKLKSMIPKGLTIQIFVWKEKRGGEEWHDRFVLNQTVGVTYTVGLDTGPPGAKTLVSRLTTHEHQRLWNVYGENSDLFELVIGYPKTYTSL